MTKAINSFSEIHDALNLRGSLYVRWSRGPEFDMVAGAVSRDYQSGDCHDGLSAIDIDADMSDLQIFRFVRDYSFLRAKDAKIRPHLYAGRRIGTDSDNAHTIEATEYLGTLSDDLVAFLDEDTNADRIQLMDAISKNRVALEIYKTEPPKFIPIWTEETLRANEAKLAALGGPMEY